MTGKKENAPRDEEARDEAPLSEKDVRHIAKLARISLDGEDISLLVSDLEVIRHTLAALQEVDTEGVGVTEGVFAEPLPRREDKVEDTKREDVLKNAPDAREGFYAVPKVVE